MPARSLELVCDGLFSVDFRRDRLVSGVPVSGKVVAHVAYSDQPFDARTSAVAVVDGEVFSDSELALLRPVGAPVVAQCFGDHVLFWKQTAAAPKFLERVAAGKIASFFQKHREELAPGALFRAKVWGRVDSDFRSEFVDAGLLPLLEEESGKELTSLLERAVTKTKKALGWGNAMTAADGAWLLRAVFWLLAAKILKDKEVPGFIRGRLTDLEDVYLKLAKHYHHDDPRPVQIDGSERRDALLEAAELIQSFGHCGAVTTESLAWVYESALIDEATRQKMGTHSTPTWLVDEVVAKLRPWIAEMPVDERRVCEPACGHAGFLISAMRLLSELLPADRAGERKGYLRKRLHGIELDPFAYEVARLSLTLADVPNDNGWMLDNGDMFAGDTLRSAVGKATIVLANPPFEPFKKGGGVRPEDAMFSRADETFRRIVDALPVGGVFGVVLPQTILHSTQGKELRRKLLDEYEISEITLFADKVFNFGEPETAVILGRRVGDAKKSGIVRYRRVREEQVEIYKKTLEATSADTMKTSVFEAMGGILRVPELPDVWHVMRDNPRLGDLVSGGKGFEHKGADDPTLPANAILESETPFRGGVLGYAGWDYRQLTHQLPTQVWLNLSESVVRRSLHGTVCGLPQVILNHARVSRGVWRLNALLDIQGHPLKGRFLVWRPSCEGVTPMVLWAMLNSPISNAYAYSYSTKRDILGKDILAMPVFPLSAGPFDALEAAVDAYFHAAAGSRPIARNAEAQPRGQSTQLGFKETGDEQNEDAPAEEELKHLHWRIDAEVLRLYNLPAQTERRILDLFTGVRRRGVPFVQDTYFPKGFTALERLSDLLAITADWGKTNRRRGHLIRKDIKKTITPAEKEELARLESLSDARIDLEEIEHPSQPDEIDLVVERLKREGKWPE